MNAPQARSRLGRMCRAAAGRELCCAELPALCWRKEPLLLRGVINHLKRVMTGTKDRAVPQPPPQGNGPRSGFKVRFIAGLCWSRGTRERDF